MKQFPNWCPKMINGIKDVMDEEQQTQFQYEPQYQSDDENHDPTNTFPQDDDVTLHDPNTVEPVGSFNRVTTKYDFFVISTLFIEDT